MKRISIIGVTFALFACGGGSGDNANSNSDSPFGIDRSLNLDSTHVELDPYGTAPLSARLSFTAPVEGSVKITVKGKGENGIDISHQFDQIDTNFILPILGLYPDFNNTVVVDFTSINGDSAQDILNIATSNMYVTDDLRVSVPVDVEIINSSLGTNDQNVYQFSQQKSAIDQNGDLRWVYRDAVGGWQFYRKLPNGNWLGAVEGTAVNYHFQKFAEFTMLGEKVREYSVENLLHHEVQLLPWGNFLVASNSSLIDFATNGVPEEDILIEIDSNTGAVVKTWDFNLILQPDRPPLPTNKRSDDWLHNNAAHYYEDDHSIVITSQRQSLAAKIDYETGAIRWILSDPTGWDTEFKDKLLSPVDSEGNPLDWANIDFWPYAPHAAQYHNNNRLIIFDNGTFRGWFQDEAVAAESYSRGVEYEIDESLMTAKLVWQYDAGKTLFTRITGDIDYLSNGNYLIGFAGNSPDTPRVVEVTPDGNVVFEAVMNRGELEYRVEKYHLYEGL